MGDKSPKANKKQATQKKNTATATANKKSNDAAAKQADKTKK